VVHPLTTCKVGLGLGVHHTAECSLLGRQLGSTCAGALSKKKTCAGAASLTPVLLHTGSLCERGWTDLLQDLFERSYIYGNEGQNLSTRPQVHPMIKIWQSILLCLSHRRFPSLCRSLSNRSFFMCSLPLVARHHPLIVHHNRQRVAYEVAVVPLP
jgi:hypothetical protein